MKKSDVISKVKSHTKIIASIVVGYGVGEIMGNVMKDYKPDSKGLKKALIKLGAAALTGMIVKEVCKFVESEIDEVFDFVNDISVEKEDTSDSDEEDLADSSEETIFFETEKKAKDVLAKMNEKIKNFGSVSMHSYLEYAERPTNWEQSNYIWTDLKEAKICKSCSGYYILLPKPKHIMEKE